MAELGFKARLARFGALPTWQQCLVNGICCRRTRSIVKANLHGREECSAISITMSGRFPSLWPWLSFVPSKVQKEEPPVLLSRDGYRIGPAQVTIMRGHQRSIPSRSKCCRVRLNWLLQQVKLLGSIPSLSVTFV